MTNEKLNVPQSHNPADGDWAEYWIAPPADATHWPSVGDASAE